MLDLFKKKTPFVPQPVSVKAPGVNRTARFDLPVEPGPLQGKGISFNPDLIKQYHADHRELFALFDRVTQAAEPGQWLDIDTAMGYFRTALADHLLSESVRLYVYLKQQLAGDEDSIEMVRRFSSEMKFIGRTWMGCMDGQLDLSRSPNKQAAFLPVWMDIGRVLGDRIAREEKTLYPMYLDSN